MSTEKQLLAYAEHLEQRLAHATEFRYGVIVARTHGRKWRVTSDDGSVHVEFDGDEAQDAAIREAARLGR